MGNFSIRLEYGKVLIFIGTNLREILPPLFMCVWIQESRTRLPIGNIRPVKLGVHSERELGLHQFPKTNFGG
jgi:hypothetical protein